jgi:hypothetical protein
MTTRSKLELQSLGIVHPLFDEPEAKLSAEGLGRIKMSRSVKVSLFALRAYLVLMFVLLAYHMLQLATAAPHLGK